MEAYLRGVSTRKVDDFVKSLGTDTDISQSEVSRICADLDRQVAAKSSVSTSGILKTNTSGRPSCAG